MQRTDECLEKAKFDQLVPLNVLSDSHREELRAHSAVLSLDQGESFSGGAEGNRFTYYIIEGVLGLFVGDQQLDEISADSEAAKFALTRLSSAPVTGTAKTPTKLLQLDISLVSTLLIWVQSQPDEHARALTMDDDSGWVAKVLGSELFARIPPTNIQQLFSRLQPQTVRGDDVVIKQGDIGDYYYLIQSGKCAVTRQAGDGEMPVLLASLDAGDGFGEEALVAAARRNATVTMVSDGTLLRLTKEDFQALISQPVLSNIGSVDARQVIALGGQWLDVRIAEEHNRNGIEGSLNLPLDKLRDETTSLEPQISYVVYSDTGRRAAAAAFILAERGFTAHVLQGGLMEHPSLCGSGATAPRSVQSAQSPEPAPVTDPRTLSKAVEDANQDVESALQDKLDATTARRMLATEFDTETEADAKRKLASRQKRLELESATATAALAQAQRRKLEAESKMRAAEALAERRRAEAEIECDNLRRGAEQRLRVEEKRLQDQYAIAASKLEELKRTREETELRLQRERERIDTELAASEQTLQFEAEKIKTDLERVRRDSEEKAGRIRDDEASEEERVRTETEFALKEERQRLEAEFASSISALQKAQLKLDAAKQAKAETDAESQRIVAAMRLAEETRRKRAEAQRDSERSRLEAQANEAKATLQRAEEQRTQAESRRRAAIQKLARLRAASGDAVVTEEQAENLEAEIQRISENVSDALGEVDEAQRAMDDADAMKFATEEKVAHQRATEEELRLKLHEEAEEWLEQERARSAAELERAKQELAEKWALKEEAEQRRRETMEAQDVSLLGDITAQLSVEDSSIKAAVGDKVFAEKQAHLAEAAKQSVTDQKERSLEEIGAASAQIARLKRQGLLD